MRSIQNCVKVKSWPPGIKVRYTSHRTEKRERRKQERLATTFHLTSSSVEQVFSYLHGVDECLGGGHSQGARKETFLKGRGPMRSAEGILTLAQERGA